MGQPGTKLAQHAIKRRFSAIFRALGEFSHAQADNKPSRANFFTHRTQPRGNCETAITTATADADQHETTITTATEKLTQNTHFSPAKAMAVSVEAEPARAKATPVSLERFPMPAGYGGAWPGFETTHPATHSNTAPPVWRAPEGPEGTGGLRDRPLRAKLACGDLAGGRARRRPEHQRSRKQQAQSQITAAPPAWRAQEGQAAVPVGGGAWPRCRWVAAGPGRASRSTTPSRQARVWRSRGRAAAHRHTQRPGPTKQRKTAARHSKRGRHQPTPCSSALTHP